eukprot:jgi/Mesen1/3731/ME000203S02820
MATLKLPCLFIPDKACGLLGYQQYVCTSRQVNKGQVQLKCQCGPHKVARVAQEKGNKDNEGDFGRRLLLASAAVTFPAAAVMTLASNAALAETAPSNFAEMPALKGKDYGKSKMHYPDYTETPSGLQYKVDWDGFTIGYYGRIFEARNKAKGGSFEGSEKDFFRFQLGAGQVIPAFEEAIVGMHVGGVRRHACFQLPLFIQALSSVLGHRKLWFTNMHEVGAHENVCRIIVPPDLGYPDNDLNRLGPKPITFSGQRALDFVLKNQGMIDKTLLFDIELLKVINTR